MISPLIEDCCPVIIPNTAIIASSATPIAFLGILSIINDAMNIPKGAPKGQTLS